MKKNATPSTSKNTPQNVPGADYVEEEVLKDPPSKADAPGEWSMGMVSPLSLPLVLNKCSMKGKITRSIVCALNGNAIAASEVLDWHNENPGLLTPELQYTYFSHFYQA